METGWNPVREVPAATAVPQIALTKRDRELQTEEGVSPMEVASAEQSALQWLNERQRKDEERERRRAAALQETPEPEPESALSDGPEMDEPAASGTLFNDRS